MNYLEQEIQQLKSDIIRINKHFEIFKDFNKQISQLNKIGKNLQFNFQERARLITSFTQVNLELSNNYTILFKSENCFQENSALYNQYLHEQVKQFLEPPFLFTEFIEQSGKIIQENDTQYQIENKFRHYHKKLKEIQNQTMIKYQKNNTISTKEKNKFDRVIYLNTHKNVSKYQNSKILLENFHLNQCHKMENFLIQYQPLLIQVYQQYQNIQSQSYKNLQCLFDFPLNFDEDIRKQNKKNINKDDIQLKIKQDKSKNESTYIQNVTPDILQNNTQDQLIHDINLFIFSQDAIYPFIDKSMNNQL